MKNIKSYIVKMFGGIIIILTISFSTIFILTERNSSIENIDKNLHNIIFVFKELFPENFHDSIFDKNSVSPEKYYNIVARNNKLCKKLDLQYLWSVILINENVHFTTATSPDKDVTNEKHAGFFDIHSNPEAFNQVFSEMKPLISEFHNEWGDGRMILSPFMDKLGRKYCFGASISIEDVNAQMMKNIYISIIILLVLLLIFLPLNYLVAKSISEPIKSITKVANDIALDKAIPPLKENKKKWAEIVSLNNSLSIMYRKLQERISALEIVNLELEKKEENLRNQNLILDQKIEERTQELNQLLKDKDRFITILAHDLKGPFGSMLGVLQLLKQNINKYDKTKIETIIFTINSSFQKIYNLLDDILFWIRAQSDKLPFEPKRLNVKKIFNDVVCLLNSMANEKKIRIELEVEDSVNVYADKDMLSTILRNLLSNAIKFTKKEGKVAITAININSTIEFSVSDNGIGMSQDIVNKLFDITQKISTEGTANEKGTGLGLLLCKELIEKHNGEINVESEVGKGSTFHFTLPYSN